VRDAELGQLPVEPRDLLLELALGLFMRQTFALEGSPGLGESGPLLLELGLRVLARDLFLPELLLRRGE
jgi:hypothetical protein